MRQIQKLAHKSHKSFHSISHSIEREKKKTSYRRRDDDDEIDQSMQTSHESNHRLLDDLGLEHRPSPYSKGTTPFGFGNGYFGANRKSRREGPYRIHRSPQVSRTYPAIFWQ
jgi:hypothetical protein